MLNLKELYEQLKALGYDVAYHHFEEEPTLPFIAYYEDNDREYLYADNANYHEQMQMTIEVYTEERDESVIEKVQQILIDNKITYTLVPFLYLEDQKMYMSDFGFVL